MAPDTPPRSPMSLPQVAGMSPSMGSSGRPRNRSLVKLPSILSETGSCTSDACAVTENEGEHADFEASFGHLAGDKTPVHSFQAQMASILASFKFFQDLDSGVQAKLPSIMTTTSKRAGTVLFRQGDPPGSCYIVLRGEATILVKTEEELAADAEETPSSSVKSGIKTVEGFSTYNEESRFGVQIGVLGPGTLVGEPALLNDHPRSASIRCIRDTDFLVIRRCDFDNILKEEMVRKGDDRFRFLMAHVPGMRDVAVPKSCTKIPHSSYFFKKLTFSKGHCFFQEGEVAEPSIVVVHKGSAECSRLELTAPGVGSALPTSLSMPVIAEDLFGGAKLGNYRRTADMISRSTYAARLRSMAREKELGETINRVGVLMPGSVFGSLPIPEKEPFTVTVTSPQCEVFVCSGADLFKLPRKLLDTIREHLAQTAAWRLKSHSSTQDFRKRRGPEKDKSLSKRQPLIRIRSSPVI